MGSWFSTSNKPETPEQETSKSLLPHDVDNDDASASTEANKSTANTIIPSDPAGVSNVPATVIPSTTVGEPNVPVAAVIPSTTDAIKNDLGGGSRHKTKKQRSRKNIRPTSKRTKTSSKSNKSNKNRK